MTVWFSVPLTADADTTCIGSDVAELALTTNAGFGTVSPLAATHAGQSCASVRVIVTLATVTEKPLLSLRIVTPLGSRLSTVMLWLCAGTTQRTSTIGAVVGMSTQATSSMPMTRARRRLAA